MVDVVGKKNWYFLLSGLVIIPGFISLILFGLNLGIDFTGGSRLEYQISPFDKLRVMLSKVEASNIKYQVSSGEVKDVVSNQGIEVSSIQKTDEQTYIIRTKPITQEENQKVKDALSEKFDKVEGLSFETVGATVSQETLLNAVKAILLACFLIILYIAWSFRQVPRPASSWRFGACAIIALIHDVLIVVGVFSILGKIVRVEVDSLFVTALLAIIGFSVHDTIVVFDRIRENLKKMMGKEFSKIVNESILQTMRRSINTSLTVIIVLVGLLVFGGESIRWFVVALLVGIISGTYSSIFTASPLLVVWHDFSTRRHSGER